MHALVWVCPLCDAGVIDELQLAEAAELGRAEQAASEALEQHIADHVEQMVAAADDRCGYVGAFDVRCTLPPHGTDRLHCPGHLLDRYAAELGCPDGFGEHLHVCGCKRANG